jgi:hypothetical protein
MFTQLSLKKILAGVHAVFNRFPTAATCSIIWTISCILLVEDIFDFKSTEWVQIMHVSFASFIGVLAFLLTSIVSESHQKLAKYKWHIQVLTLVAVFLYYLSLPSDIQTFTYKPIFIFISLIVILLMGISSMPFWNERSNMKFWHYNKSIFFLFFESLFFSLILMGGISLALTALDFLFSVDIEPSLYGDLACLISGIFFSFHFLSEFPVLSNQHESKAQSRVYSIFSIYMLIPLVLIYFVILYAFGIKLIFTEWPNGWVASLVLWFSVIGIFAYIFNYPFIKSDSKLSILFKQGFFYSLIPLSILLFLAVLRRISDYRFTEARILIMLLSAWLFGISLYFIFSKGKLLRVIPASLLCIGILSLFGPWNIFNISSTSQISRLKSIAENNELLIDNILLPVSDKTSDKVKMELGNTINYLHSRKKLNKITSILASKDRLVDQGIVDKDSLLNYLGISKRDIDIRNLKSETHYFNAELPDKIDLSGYEFMFSLAHYPTQKTKDSIWVNLDLKQETIDIFVEDKRVDNLDISLLINNLYNNKYINYDELSKNYFDLESGSFNAKLYLTNFSCDSNPTARVSVFEGLLLLKSKAK